MDTLTKEVRGVIRDHWGDVHARESCSTKCLADAVSSLFTSKLRIVQADINHMRIAHPKLKDAGWNSALFEASNVVEDMTRKNKKLLTNP